MGRVSKAMCGVEVSVCMPRCGREESTMPGSVVVSESRFADDMTYIHTYMHTYVHHLDHLSDLRSVLSMSTMMSLLMSTRACELTSAMFARACRR